MIAYQRLVNEEWVTIQPVSTKTALQGIRFIQLMSIRNRRFVVLPAKGVSK